MAYQRCRVRGAFDRVLPKSCARLLPIEDLESMAAGVPVVASDIPVVREIVEDGFSGHLVQPGRPETLALALRHMVENADYREELSKNGKKVIEETFTWEASTTQQKSIYRQLPLEPAKQEI